MGMCGNKNRLQKLPVTTSVIDLLKELEYA